MPVDVVGLVAALLAIVAVGAHSWFGRPEPSPRIGKQLSASDPSIAPPVPAASSFRGAKARMPRQQPRPVRLRIRAIGVDARIVRLGVARDGSMQVPTDYATAGWFAPGPEPGERGAAVIAGHVDSKDGPAAFFRLGQLHRGDPIRVTVAGGHTIRFRVDGIERWPKAKFPTKRVFGKTRHATLRLITCSGPFDRSSGHYVDNTIVYAVRETAGRN